MVSNGINLNLLLAKLKLDTKFKNTSKHIIILWKYPNSLILIALASYILTTSNPKPNMLLYHRLTTKLNYIKILVKY